MVKQSSTVLIQDRKKPKEDSKTRAFKIDLYFTAAQLKIVEQIAGYEKQTTEEFLADEVESIVGTHLGGGAITDLLSDVWNEQIKSVQWLPKHKQGYNKVTVTVTLNEDKAKILKLVKDVSEKYLPDSFSVNVMECIRADLDAERSGGSPIPEEIANKLYGQWRTLMKKQNL